MKYWTYMKGEVPGSYEPAALAALPGFSMTTLVCPGEGEIAEKNWRRAGEFADIVSAIEAHQQANAPAAPLGQPPVANEVDSLLDTASTRLFSHVADLMKELETRRDEKSLIVSLQRHISALKDELNAAREARTMLELRIPRIDELEEAHRKDREALAKLQEALTARDHQLVSNHGAYEKVRAELDMTRIKLQEAGNDLSIRNRLVDKLSHDLSEKELSLAKSLGIIRRLEEDLHRLVPSAEIRKSAPAAAPVERAAPPPPPAQATPIPEPAPRQALELPEFKAPTHEAKAPLPDLTSAFTNDEPPPTPPYLEPNQMPVEEPQAHAALMGFFKKVFPGQSH